MQKSRPWAAMFAVVVLAALVVLSGCQGAVGKTGPAGPAGESGTTGTTGTPGTTDNMSPVATAIPTVYLALNGTAYVAPAATDPTDVVASTTGYKDKTVDLTKYFKDTETPTLAYTAVSTDKTIATAGAIVGGKLKITGVKADKTTIIATAFDGVNAGVPTTINVIVVANNSPPSAGLPSPVTDLTGKLKLITDSAQEVAFTAIINAGPSGEPTEAITFRTEVGDGLAATVELVSAVTKHVSGNSYILTVTRKKLKSGTNDVSGMQAITIFAKDSFGAETLVDLNGVVAVVDPPVAESSLVVEVNAPPRLAQAMPDVFLYRSVTDTVLTAGLAPTGKPGSVMYNIADFFAVEYTSVANVLPVVVNDTTCVFTTSPKQPTGLAADPGPPVVVAGPIKATSMASVAGTYTVAVPATADVPAIPAELSSVMVDASVTMTVGDAEVVAAGFGDFTLTITCTDTEKSVSDTATITVRP